MQAPASYEQAKAELDAVLNSGWFAHAPGLAQFLSYVGSKCLEGQANHIKEYNIAVEALGRLRASGASALLQHMLDARQVWRWVYPNELRIAAAQAFIRVDPTVGMEKVAASGLDRKELTLEPSDPEANASVIRQRRYARLKLSRNLLAVTTNLRENFRLSIPELNLGGGIGSGERHLAPGSLLTLKFSQGVRHIKAQAIVRGARPQAMAFEFVEMDLDERYRLRKLLLELGGLPMVAQVTNRTRRRGRVAISRN